jgi:23S rRNA pseudouridine1911/1915/1917 synthase
LDLYPFSVIYEDNHLLVVNKQRGVLAQGDETGDPALPDFAKQYLKEKYAKPGQVFCGLVHRLDRPVSGLVVLAKTSKALERMNELFKTRQVDKTYWAVSHRAPAPRSGKLVHWLVKDGARNVTKAHPTQVPNSQYAELGYTLMASVKERYLLEIKPLTGRPHQIRVQLAALGSPICGDEKYGGTPALVRGGIHLHARSLAFVHPIKQEKMLLRADPPQDALWDTFAQLRLVAD